MPSGRDIYLERVKDIVLDALAVYPVSIYLFGSCATGTARHTSDVDVAVDPYEPLPPHVLAGLREALEESTVPYRVDIVDLSAAGEDLRRSVRKEGKVWKSCARS